MEILVTYDVATETAAGRRRLRRVAKVCEGFGQRVQKSVFECVISEGDLVHLASRLRREVNEHEDSLRIYRLREPRNDYVQVIGRDVRYDIHDTIVV
jgi:CRISPR-associated protein Cas2